MNLIEDIIKQINKNKFGSDRIKLIDSLSENLGISKSKIHHSLNSIIKMDLVELTNGNYNLTKKGEKVAERLIRSHRLWETYITEKNIVNIEDIHQDAEKYEHVLSDDLLAEIDEELGHPDTDPHGSPIPKKTE